MAEMNARTTELMGRLSSSIDLGRLGVARPLLNVLKRLDAPAARLGEGEARILILEGCEREAQELLDELVATYPEDFGVRLLRADLFARRCDHASAANDAAACVLLRPDLAVASVALGRALIHLGRHADAVACLRDAVAKNPASPQARLSLAQALDISGDPEAAAQELRIGSEHAEQHPALRTAAILLSLRQQKFAEAEALAVMAVRDGVVDGCILGLLGHARSSLGKHEAAAEAYAEARKLAPDDPYVAHLAATAGLCADPGRASRDYVRIVFDGYASRFDEHLMALGYRVPGLVRIEAERLLDGSSRLLSVLDLGCGTGLVGVALAGLPIGPLEGVDLSPGMLSQAAERGLYAKLHDAELEDFLACDGRGFDLIVAADVLPYLGDLTRLFALIASRLVKSGHVLLSVERSDPLCHEPPEWSLGRLGRYRHSPSHVRRAAALARLEIVFMREEVIRFEGAQPVPGLLAALKHSAP